MFDANAHGTTREANSAAACWAGQVGLATQCGRHARDPNRALCAAAFDRVAFGAPAQQAAGQIGDILVAVLLQDDRR